MRPDQDEPFAIVSVESTTSLLAHDRLRRRRPHPSEDGRTGDEDCEQVRWRTTRPLPNGFPLLHSRSDWLSKIPLQNPSRRQRTREPIAHPIVLAPWHHC